MSHDFLKAFGFAQELPYFFLNLIRCIFIYGTQNKTYFTFSLLLTMISALFLCYGEMFVFELN